MQIEKASKENKIARKLRYSRIIRYSLQFLQVVNNLDSDFYDELFLNPQLPPLNYLKEFICYVDDYSKLTSVFGIFAAQNKEILSTNMKRLERFGIYFGTSPS